MLKCFPEIIPCMAQLWNICYSKPSVYSREWALVNSVTTAFHLRESPMLTHQVMDCTIIGIY